MSKQTLLLGMQQQQHQMNTGTLCKVLIMVMSDVAVMSAFVIKTWLFLLWNHGISQPQGFSACSQQASKLPWQLGNSSRPDMRVTECCQHWCFEPLRSITNSRLNNAQHFLQQRWSWSLQTEHTNVYMNRNLLGIQSAEGYIGMYVSYTTSTGKPWCNMTFNSLWFCESLKLWRC